MKPQILIFSVLVLLGCTKDVVSVRSDLESYIEDYKHLDTDYLIACAGGNNASFMGSTETPISIFYYKVDGFEDVQIFETSDPNYTDYSSYHKVDLSHENLFNGRMGRFLSPSISNLRYMIVTYVTDSKIHISEPIRIDAATFPTVDIANELTIQEDSIHPIFNWQNDNVNGNVIYFSLVSDSNDNFISGIYTEVKNWQFYDLTDVVLNVTPTSNPVLDPSSSYQYIHMGVDDNNWVRSFTSKSFSTN